MYQKSRIFTANPSKYKGVLTNQDINLTVVLEKGPLVKHMYMADPSLKDLGEIEQFGGKNFTQFIDLRLFMIDTNIKNCSYGPMKPLNLTANETYTEAVDSIYEQGAPFLFDKYTSCMKQY